MQLLALESLRFPTRNLHSFPGANKIFLVRKMAHKWSFHPSNALPWLLWKIKGSSHRSKPSRYFEGHEVWYLSPDSTSGCQGLSNEPSNTSESKRVKLNSMFFRQGGPKGTKKFHGVRNYDVIVTMICPPKVKFPTTPLPTRPKFWVKIALKPLTPNESGPTNAISCLLEEKTTTIELSLGNHFVGCPKNIVQKGRQSFICFSALCFLIKNLSAVFSADRCNIW